MNPRDVKVQGDANRCMYILSNYADKYQVTYICTFTGEKDSPRFNHAISPKNGITRDTIYIYFTYRPEYREYDNSA